MQPAGSPTPATPPPNPPENRCEGVVQAVKAGEAELGLLGAASPPHTGGLRVLPIEDQPLVLVSPPEDDAPGERGEADRTATVSREILAGARLIASKRGSLMRRL